MFDCSGIGICSPALPTAVFKSSGGGASHSVHQSKYPLASRQGKMILGLSEHESSAFTSGKRKYVKTSW